MKGTFREPWKPWRDTIVDADGNLVIGACVFAENNKRRIVACVNAVAGIPTEELERWSSVERVWRIGVERSATEFEAIVERVLEKHGLLPKPAAATMTDHEALVEAQRRWGPEGSIYDRATFAPMAAWNDLPRFWVGGPLLPAKDCGPYGNGATWEEAFADADRRAAAAVKMSADEQAEQAKSFVYGNLHLDNPEVTREIVEAQHAKLDHRHTMSCYDNSGTLVCGGVE